MIPLPVAPNEERLPKLPPATPNGISWSSLFAALGIYLSLVAALRYSPFLLAGFDWQEPSAQRTSGSGRSIVINLWLLCTILAALFGRSFMLRFLFSGATWPDCLQRSFKSLWVTVLLGAVVIWLADLTVESGGSAFLVVVAAAIIATPLQVYFSLLSQEFVWPRGAWRAAVLMAENAFVFFMGFLGTATLMLVSS